MFPNFLFCFVFKGLELLVPHCAGRTRILCVRFTCLVRPSFDSATGATLNTGGWLDLTRQGLSPCKIRQASLGARTIKLSRARPRALLGPRRSPGVGCSTWFGDLSFAQ